MHYAKWDPEAVLREQNKSFNNLRKFALAFWKTFNMQKSYKCYYAKVFLISLIFLPIVSLIRGLTAPEIEDKVIYNPVEVHTLDQMHLELGNLKHNSSVLVPRLYFTPPYKPFERIIQLTVEKLKLDGYDAVEDNREMELRMQKTNYLAGVRFRGVKSNISELPIELDYELRFPPVLRTSPNKMKPLFWPTKKRYSLAHKHGARLAKTNYTGIPPGYFEEGFIQVQHAIAMSFIELKAGYKNLNKKGKAKIQMVRFPYRRFRRDEYIIHLKILLALAMAFMYAFPSYAIVKAITDENERGIMKMLRIEELNWCAWLVIIFILQVISSLFSLMILTPSLGTHSTFQYSNWLPIFCFLLCYVCANSSFILMIAVVVIRRKVNAKYALLIRIITIAPYPFILIFYYDVSYDYKILSCLSHDTALAIGFYIILEFESSGEGFNWKNFAIPHFAGEDFCIPHVVGMLLLDSILFMLILIYFHYKYPPEVECMSVDRQTIAKSWYYPLEAVYKRVLTRSFVNEALWFLVVHLTAHEDDLDNKANVPVNIRDKDTQTATTKTGVDQGTMTQRIYTPSTSEKDIAPTNFRLQSYPSRVLRPAPYKRRVPLEAPPSTSTESSDISFFKHRFVPEPLYSWSSLEDSSFTSLGPESISTSDSARSTMFYKNAVVNEPLFDKNHGIQVINVSKHVGDTDYLRNITMTIHPNEITVILKQQNDHNMFLSKIISGEVSVTSGQVIVDGHDIAHYKGTDTLCTILPTASIVFNQLTTCENLYFYMHLRGMRNYRQIIREIYKYLELLQMDMDEAEILADTLSFGQARLVSLCCALVGGNHAVIVDDPCLGLRQKWRFKMWDLLKAVSRNRVVIVKTHYNDEAEMIGDRIAVIYCGYLQCFDRNKHLRDNFCNNYNLHCDVVASRKDNDMEFLSLLRKHFPLGAHVKRMPSSGQIDVTLPGGHELQMADLINELELKGNQMGLGLLWVRQKTFRDVFMKDIRDRFDHDEMNRLLYACLDTSLNEEDEMKRTFQQFRACMHKKMIQLTRYFWIPVTILVLLSVCVFMNHQSSHFSHLPKVNLSIAIYRDSEVLMKLDEDLQSEEAIYTMTKGYEFQHERIDARDDYDHSFKYLHGRRELVPYILFLEMISVLRVETFYVAAAVVTRDDILCYWNNKLLHSAPISLNMMHNAYAYYFLGKKSEIRVVNHPIKFSNELILEQYNIHSSMKLGIGNLLMLILCAMVAMMVIPLISEFTTGNRRVIYLSGNSMNMYWITHILADMLVFIVVATYLVVLLVVHDALVNTEKRNYDDVYLVLSMFTVLILFGMAVLPFVYLLAALFGRIFFGFMITLLILGGSSILINLVIQLSEIPGWHSIYNLFIWSPTMNMYRGLRNIHVNRALRRVCEKLGGCRNEEACCHLPDYMDYKYPGILSEVVMLVLLQILYGLLLMTVIRNPFFFEDFFRVVRDRFIKANPMPAMSSAYSDVRDEKAEVDNLQTSDLDKYPLIFKNVSKRMGKLNQLSDISFMVHPREVFGVLGISTSGKSHIIQMTVGCESISEGDIFVQGVSVSQHPTRTYSHLGYCPWGNTLLGHMTVREILHFYCLLNGRKLKYVPRIIDNLCKALYLDKYLNRRIDNLGFSQRRQLTVGISVLSSTKTVMMDEPTRGVSQESKILIWQLIHLLKHVGRTVVMTTEDIDETIELCDYIAIIVNGSLTNIGTVDHLTSFYCRGCSVEIYMQKVIYTRHRRRVQATYIQLVGASFFSDYYSSDDESDQWRSDDFSFSSTEDNLWTRKAMRYNDVRSFMRQELPFAELQAQFGQYLQYYIPFEAMVLSDIFKAMVAVKEELDVDSYRITRTSLSEMYEKNARQRKRGFDEKRSRERYA